MPSSVLDRASSAQRQMLKMGSEADLNKVEKLDRAVIGRAIQRALDHANLTAKAAAIQMGYADPTIISRWIAGSESPNLAKLWTLGRAFQQGLVIALAGACTTGVKVETTVTLSATGTAL